MLAQRAQTAAVLIVGVTLSVGAALVQASQAARPVNVHVGPQSTNGFVEVDQNILAAIRDLEQEIRRNRRFRIVSRVENADLSLIVIRSGRADSSVGSVIAPAPGIGAVALNIEHVAVEVRLRVGDYEKPLVGVDETRRHAARRVVRDLDAWATANRARLPQ